MLSIDHLWRNEAARTRFQQETYQSLVSFHMGSSSPLFLVPKEIHFEEASQSAEDI